MTPRDQARLRRCLLANQPLPYDLGLAVLGSCRMGFGNGPQWHLRECLALCPGSSHWSKCVSLAAVLATFEAHVWPELSRREVNVYALEPLHRHLLEALASGEPFPRSSRRLFDYLA